ncbi:hypothetical protein Xoosp13_267 [Xanthomonas phage Xoo-sp13]|nr:hypothetical protein Xoosp13_267 [Xanthomonas phage Xoo-sp13]
MKKKIIFLDFDGVINSVRSVVADQKCVNALQAKHAILAGHKIASGFDPVAVKLIWQICNKLDAYIVVSSAWRKAININDIRKIFHTEFGWSSGPDERIIGVTGRHDNGFRGDEIQAWIDSHTVGITNFQYIIVDDSYDFHDHQHKRFIQTDPYNGFSYENYSKALELFGSEEDPLGNAL